MLVRGIPVPRYPGLRVGLPPRAALRERWTLERPDAVYVATEGPLGWSAIRAARRFGVPVLSGFHTNFHGYARHYRGGWLGPGVARYLRWFHNHTDGTLVATNDLRSQLHARGFENLSVLGRGVDGRLFTPERRCPALRRAWGVSESEPVILYIGRIAPEKNIELAIAAYRAMQRQQPLAALRARGGRSAAGQLAARPSRSAVLRRPHRRAARRALRVRRRVPVPQRDGDLRERDAGGAGERTGGGGVRLRGRSHAHRARRDGNAHPLRRRPGLHRRRGGAPPGPGAAWSECGGGRGSRWPVWAGIGWWRGSRHWRWTRSNAEEDDPWSMAGECWSCSWRASWRRCSLRKDHLRAADPASAGAHPDAVPPPGALGQAAELLGG